MSGFWCISTLKTFFKCAFNCVTRYFFNQLIWYKFADCQSFEICDKQIKLLSYLLLTLLCTLEKFKFSESCWMIRTQPIYLLKLFYFTVNIAPTYKIFKGPLLWTKWCPWTIDFADIKTKQEDLHQFLPSFSSSKKKLAFPKTLWTHQRHSVLKGQLISEDFFLVFSYSTKPMFFFANFRPRL